MDGAIRATLQPGRSRDLDVGCANASARPTFPGRRAQSLQLGLMTVVVGSTIAGAPQDIKKVVEIGPWFRFALELLQQSGGGLLRLSHQPNNGLFLHCRALYNNSWT